MAECQIKKIAIVGAGNQGPKVAYRCVVSNFDTFLYSRSSNTLESGKKRLLSYLNQELIQKEAEIANTRLHFTTSLSECIPEADLIIEAVKEDVEIKRQVLAAISLLSKSKALICTNSSSIKCSQLADVTKRPDKVFNINFSNPVHDNLVEIMKGKSTSDETLIAGVRFIRSLNMVPLITYREIMGFSFNRVWRAIKREALYLVDRGYSDFQDLDRAWIMEFGMPYGPFGLMDILGLDIIRDIEQQYFKNSGKNRDKPPKLLDEMIAKGHLGVKTGHGFYEYPNPAYKEPNWLNKTGQFSEDIVRKLALLK